MRARLGFFLLGLIRRSAYRAECLLFKLLGKPRGLVNPLFKGAVPRWDGVIVKEKR